MINPISFQVNYITGNNFRCRITIIGSTFFLHILTNSILFESMTFFPMGWLIVKNSCTYSRENFLCILIQSSTKMETYQVLFKTHYVIKSVFFWSIGIFCMRLLLYVMYLKIFINKCISSIK